MKHVVQSVLSLAILMMASSVMAQGLTGYYQSLGLSSGSTSTVGLSSYGSSNTYTPNYDNYNFNTPSTNYNSVGSNTFNTNYSSTGGTSGGLSEYYANNGITTTPSNSTTSGGFAHYFSQNLQANTFTRSCPVDNIPDPSTCQGGQYQRITDNYGCTVEWRCEGGTFCPVEERPTTQCNGIWEPQYSTATQCLTHYFCDRTPTSCTMEYAPVCGELNGRSLTYSNNCLLAAAGAQFLYEGQCFTYPDPDVRPVINRFKGPSALQVGEMGTWKVSASGGSNAQLSYSIDWGDTYDYAADQTSLRRRTSQQTTFTHEYAQPGTYTVRVTVSNQQGQSATASSTVRVEDKGYGAPTIDSFTGPNSLEVSETGTWSVSASDSLDADIIFSIEWGEYVYRNGNTLRTSPPLRGAYKTFQHAYAQPGTYHVTVTATGRGGSTSKTLTVQVVPKTTTDLAPVVHGISGPTSLTVNQTGTWSVQASDPQNQDLRYQINWGDRYQYGAQAAYSSDSGFVQNSAFTHQYSEPGTYTVAITVMNTAGKTARTTTTVRVNQNPIIDRPYDYPKPDYFSDDNSYDYYQNRYNQYQNNGNRHSFFNRSYNGR